MIKRATPVFRSGSAGWGLSRKISMKERLVNSSLDQPIYTNPSISQINILGTHISMIKRNEILAIHIIAFQ